MRTSILSVALGVSMLGACQVGQVGGGTPGGGSGDDGTTADSGVSNTPLVTAAVDKPAVTTMLGNTDVVTLTLTGSGGFSGQATITATLVDATDTPLPGIAVTGLTSANLTENGTTTVPFSLVVATDAGPTAGWEEGTAAAPTTMTGTFKIEVSSSAGTAEAASAYTLQAVYLTTFAAGTGTDINNHADVDPVTHLGMGITVRRGALLEFLNNDNINHLIHGDGAFPHEEPQDGSKNTMGAANMYVVDTIADVAGSTGDLGCHDHGAASTYGHFTID